MEKVKTRRNPVKMDWTWRYWWEHMVSNIYRNRDVNEGEAGFQNTDGEMALGWEAECFFLKIKK